MAKAKFGLMAGIAGDLVATFRRIQSFGIPTCQLGCGGERVDELFAPETVKAAVAETGMEISGITCSFTGMRYNNKDGPPTLGLVPPAFRDVRVPVLKHFSDVVAQVGIPNIIIHIGFIPDDERDPVYQSFIPMMQQLCAYVGANGQDLLIESASELASTVRRTIRDIDADNFGVNFDTANIILYGKSNPLDAVELFGDRVRACHLKDGVWPNRDEFLGKEVPIGEGQVNFPVLIRRLKEKGFNGPFTIEREARGAEQEEGIRKALALLTPLING